jgi:replicative DNA helicase
MSSGYFESLLHSIDRGREGLNEGIPLVLPKLSNAMCNFQKKTQYLIGALPKVGKTSFTDDVFVYGLLEYILDHPELNKKIEIHYWSFEIDKDSKLAKAAARRIYRKYGIRTNINEVLSRGRNRISNELYDIVHEERTYFEQLEDNLYFYDTVENPTGVYKRLKQIAQENGTETFTEYQITDENSTSRTIRKLSGYTERNENKVIIPVIDHIALTATERGAETTKLAIDKLSKDMSQIFRNTYKMSPVIIQQLNFEAEAPERFKDKRLKPMISDFGDSKYTVRDSDIIIGLFNPSAFRMQLFDGVDITRVGDTFRNLEILRNRNGESNVNLHLTYEGGSGCFIEM